MGRGQASVADSFSHIIGDKRGLRPGQAHERWSRLTKLPEIHEAVMRDFVCGAIDAPKGASATSEGHILAVPRADDADDAFLTFMDLRNLMAVRINGEILVDPTLIPFWKEAAESLRLLCLDCSVPCRMSLEGAQRKVLQDEYRQTYTPEARQEIFDKLLALKK